VSPFDCSIADDNCLFYTQCLDSIYPCGDNGYALGYGAKFCNKFQASKEEFSPEGKLWLSSVTSCLQQELFTNVVKKEVSA
jgi:hypothetical protein